MYKMLKEETASCNNLELMKLVEKYSRWIFSVWEFSKVGGISSGPVGEIDGWEFIGWEFYREEFSSNATSNQLSIYIKVKK